MRSEPTIMLTDEVQQLAVIELEEACEDVQAPLQKLEHNLHFWVQFVIMPIFALAKELGITQASASELISREWNSGWSISACKLPPWWTKRKNQISCHWSC